MKRIANIIIAMIVFGIIVVSLSSCGSSKTNVREQQEETLSIYATVYPLFALADMVVGNVPNVQLNCLVQPQDGCLRSYQLSDWDLSLLMRGADVVIAGGRGLESFESMLYSLGESGPVVSSVLYNMELENMPAKNTDPDSDSHWNDDNPHVYMHSDGAIEIMNRIAAHLQTIDPANGEIYSKNAYEAQNKLASLSNELQTAVGNADSNKVAVLNEALLYVAHEYGLNIAVAYDRESGESLQGNDLESCLSMMQESGAKIVLIEKQAPQNLCAAIKETGFILAPMDILSTRRAEEGWEGLFAAYNENARSLARAFTAAKRAEQTIASGD